MNWQHKHSIIFVLTLFFLGLFLFVGSDNQDAPSQSENIIMESGQYSEPEQTELHIIPSPPAAASLTNSNQSKLTNSFEQATLIEDSPVVDVSEYYQLNGNEIYHKLVMLEKGSTPSVSDILLALIEQGVLSTTTAVKTDHNGFEYSALFTALVLQPNITAENIDAFLQLGSDIGSDDLWLSVITTTTNSEASELLFDHAAFGPEDQEQLLQNAFMAGNRDLFTHMMQSDDFAITSEFSNHLTQRSISMSTETIKHFDQVFNDMDAYDFDNISDDIKWLNNNMFRLNSMVENMYIDEEQKESLLQQRDRVQELLFTLEQYVQE